MVIIAALISAILAVAHAVLVVPRLPEPIDHPSDEQPKPTYRNLVTPRNVIWLFVGCFGLAQVLWLVPFAQWSAWIAYLGAGSCLVGVDLLTTYLPICLNYLVTLEVIIGIMIWGSYQGWNKLWLPLAGAAFAFSILWLVWRFIGGLGFGDVRLMLIIGMISALGGWSGLSASLLLGTIAGAVWGIIHHLLHRKKDTTKLFPYGPSLWLGPWLAILVNTIAG